MEKLKTLPILFLCVLSVGCAATSATSTENENYYDYKESTLKSMIAQKSDMIEVCESFGAQLHCSMVPKSQATAEIESAINSMMRRIGR
tara:strand:- start:282 stop:548 length:267 start_codon:yes stop_codon:yes gene_type:complete